MKICPVCKQEITIDAKFCPNCGAKLNDCASDPINENNNNEPEFKDNYSQNHSGVCDELCKSVTEAEKNNNSMINQQGNYNQVVANESNALGIIAIVFAILGGVLGFIFGVVGYATYQNPKNKKLCGWAIKIFVLWIIFFIIYLLAID